MKAHHLFVPLLWLGLVSLSGAEANWPQWRGPNLDGTSPAKGLPVKWSPTENIVWKTEMPAWSGSTPAVWGDRIFLTSPEKGGEAPAPAPAQQNNGGRGYRDPGGKKLLLLCLDFKDGKVLWQQVIGEGNYFKMKQNMSSPSPVTDGTAVWIMTGLGVLSAFDFTGKALWERDIQKDYGKFGVNHGYASSPLLFEDRLIVPVLHGMQTDEPSYLLALDKKTGKQIWKTDRPTVAIMESPDSYATPQLLMTDGRALAVINGGDIVTAHDIKTGEEVWRVNGLNPMNNPNFRIIASCVVKDGMVYAPSRRKPMLAIRAGGKGDVSKTNVAWETDLGPDVPTPVTDGKYLWITGDQGVLACLDAKTGATVYEPQRIATGNYSASPTLADGKIYATNENGTTTVLEAGPEFKVLATNELDDGYTLSTPVAIGNRLLIRTAGHLFCIADKGGKN